MAAFLRRRTLDVGSPSGVVSSFLGRLLTTRGDILRRGASAPERLAIGSSGTILRSNGTDAAWASVATALGAILTARGQIIRRGASGPEALAAQTADTFLGGDGTDVTTRTAAQVRTSLDIVTGSYTPTLTNTTNIAASTAYKNYYVTISNIVIVFLRLDVDPTAIGNCVLGVSLPVASALTAQGELQGVISDDGGGADSSAGRVVGDVTNDRAQCNFYAKRSTNAGFSAIFGYVVV